MFSYTRESRAFDGTPILPHTASAMASHDHDGDLPRSVDDLTEEVRVLRDSVDELREVVDYLVRQIPPDFWEVLRDRRITSMSRDPVSPDFRTNTVPEEDIAAARNQAAADNRSKRRRRDTSQPLFPEND
jgi:hypothetical protein